MTRCSPKLEHGKILANLQSRLGSVSSRCVVRNYLKSPMNYNVFKPVEIREKSPASARNGANFCTNLAVENEVSKTRIQRTRNYHKIEKSKPFTICRKKYVRTPIGVFRLLLLLLKFISLTLFV